MVLWVPIAKDDRLPAPRRRCRVQRGSLDLAPVVLLLRPRYAAWPALEGERCFRQSIESHPTHRAANQLRESKAAPQFRTWDNNKPPTLRLRRRRATAAL